MANYTIQKGDTLSRIAKANNTTVDALAKANNIQNVNMIRAGSELVIPGSAPANTQPAQTTQKTPASADILALMQGISIPTYSGVDLSSRYQAAGQQYTSALDAAYQAQKAQLEKQAQDLGKQYEALRTQAYTNARLGAIGNNEMLAAKGLAGNLYQGTQSGVSESSRVAQDVAMRNNLNTISTQEQAQRDAIAAEIIQTGYTKDIETARYMADLSIKQAEAEMQQAQLAYQSQMSAYGAQMDLYGAMLGDYYNSANLAMQQEAHALDMALNKLNLDKARKSSSGGTSSGTKAVTIEDILGGFGAFSGVPASQNETATIPTAAANRTTRSGKQMKDYVELIK